MYILLAVVISCLFYAFYVLYLKLSKDDSEIHKRDSSEINLAIGRSRIEDQRRKSKSKGCRICGGSVFRHRYGTLDPWHGDIKRRIKCKCQRWKPRERICWTCYKIFSTGNALFRHFKETPEHMVDYPDKCDTCREEFLKRNIYNKVYGHWDAHSICRHLIFCRDCNGCKQSFRTEY